MNKKPTYHSKSGFRTPESSFSSIQEGVFREIDIPSEAKPLHRWRPMLAAAIVACICGICVWQYMASADIEPIQPEVEYVYESDFSELTVDEFYDDVYDVPLVSEEYVVID